jgi:hypothetical protein
MASSSSFRITQHRSRITRWLILMPLLAALILGSLIWLAGADRTVGQTSFFMISPVNLYNRQPLGQTFIPPADHLHRIDLMLTTFGKHRDGIIRLSIYNEAGELLGRQEVQAASLPNHWSSFHFPTLSGVAGQMLRLDLRRNTSWRSPLGVYVAPGSFYPNGSGVINDEQDDSFDLAFRAYLATPPTLAARWERVRELAHILTVARPGWFGQPAFLYLLGVTYALGLAALIYALSASVRRS